ncbi:FAD-dependent monooxygenase [Pinibacter soli]|uniref:FAD-dependent monooxygenase n=1 Tax=Pinibacter soli TaxID=3044211 RepID=A0ABT6RAC5_9BACT|nr:FAD-dependent monooxygenase [Pinibacter soli]MDI3319518.1 FAD-dependent monooxygenase [Pinibacter soli]
MIQTNETFAIIGGGIAGLTAGIALSQKGIKTTIFEAAPEVKPVGAGIVLAANAMLAYRKLGIDTDIIPLGKQLSGFDILSSGGKLITRTDTTFLSVDGAPDNFTIHRAVLHNVLLSKIPATPIHTNKRLRSFEQMENEIVLHFEDGTTHATTYLIAADGIHSPVRKLLLPESTPRYAGYTCWRAVVNTARFNEAGSSETWGAKGRFGIAPLADDKVYWFACINAQQNDVTMRGFKVADLQKEFVSYHQDIQTLLAQTPDEALIWSDIIDLRPLQHFAFGNILLIGDAAHATTPNMGQGACQGIEDAIVLADELAKHKTAPEAFLGFEKRRLARTRNITNTSWVLGRMAQMENALLCRLRNTFMRSLPEKFKQTQVRKVLKVDF